MACNNALYDLRTQANERLKDLLAKDEVYVKDVLRLERDDRYAEAFLTHNHGNITVAIEHVVTCFKRRKAEKVLDLTHESFPLWGWEKGAVYYHGKDREDHHLLHFIIRMHGSESHRADEVQRQYGLSLQQMTKNFVLYMLEQRHQQDAGHQVTLLFDMTGAGLKNLDIDFVRFLIGCFETVFPNFLAYLLAYEMPWVLNAGWKIIQGLLSEEARAKIVFVKKPSITTYISEDNLPLHMGGSDTFTYKYEPPGGTIVDFHESHDTGLWHEEVLRLPRPSTEVDLQGSLHRRSGLRNRSATEWLSSQSGLFSSASVTDLSSHSPGQQQSSSMPPTMNGSQPSSPSPSTAIRPLHSLSTSLSDEEQRLSPQGKMCRNDLHQGKWLQISPREYLTFTQCSTSAADQQTFKLYEASISLTNTSKETVVFKLKTTAPHLYRIRPFQGLVSPGESIHIRVQSRSTFNGDTFGEEADNTSMATSLVVNSSRSHDMVQILATAASAGQTLPEALGRLKKYGRDEVMEYRLKCRLAPDLQTSRVAHTFNADSKVELSDLVSRLQKLECVISQLAMQSQNSWRMQVTLLVVILIMFAIQVTLLIYFFTTHPRP